jgi:hypothetical protein
MEVNYYITSEFEKYREYAEKAIMELIELEFSYISKEEEQILKNLNVSYKIYNDKTVKIQLLNFINYIVEEDEEEKGIYIEKTKEYEEFFKEANIIFNKNGNYINLVISKEKVRVEIIIKKDV